MDKIITSISKTVTATDGSKSREKVGEVEFWVPSLDELGVIAESKMTENGDREYTTPAARFIYTAVCNAVRATVTAKLVAGTVQLKPGAKIATTVAEVTTPTSTKGAHFAVKRAFIASFTAWIATLGKSQKWSEAMVELASKPEALASASAGNKAVFNTRVGEYFATLVENDKASFAAILEELINLSSEEEFSLDDE